MLLPMSCLRHYRVQAASMFAIARLRRWRVKAIAGIDTVTSCVCHVSLKQCCI